MIRLALLAGLLLTGCGESEPETLAPPVPIMSGDSCHVCGMLISGHPGPKGEVFMDKQAESATVNRVPAEDPRRPRQALADVRPVERQAAEGPDQVDDQDHQQAVAQQRIGGARSAAVPRRRPQEASWRCSSITPAGVSVISSSGASMPP